MIDSYSRVFAGTYFYLLRLENRGKMREHWYFAFSAAMLLGLSETFMLWGVSLIGGLHMAVMANPMRNVVIGSGLVLLNCVIFVRRQRYVPIVRKYWREKRRVTVLAIVLHAMALGLFFIPAGIVIYRMPG